MSYQALARTWRPRLFADVVGQEYVVTALRNALDSDRVHHAYLFAGTRGVGKTTLARILAKALNCEQGVGATPCSVCGACVSIDEGRFVDLIEVDAASRTKVDDTRELLDNVQYAPTSGRFKIYLIDEVHMLSGHSFNALLKTLEEPPPHVKFLLATTDPEKLPATVLSRCLQFNLRSLQPQQIREQTAKILDAENVGYDVEALEILAYAANGSLRDALSLLDQAIAYGNGVVETTGVRTMLGMVDRGYILEVLGALVDDSAERVLKVVADMAERGVDYASALDELLTALHNIALYKRSPETLSAKDIDPSAITPLASTLSEPDIQLYYQIGLIGKRDLPLAPDARSGFEMVLLRMLAFRPVEAEGAVSHQAVSDSQQTSSKPRRREPGAVGAQPGRDTATGDQNTSTSVESLLDSERWANFVAGSELSGVSRELAMNVAPEEYTNNRLTFVLDAVHEHLLNRSRLDAIQKLITEEFGHAVVVSVRIGMPNGETPAKGHARRSAEVMQATVEGIQNDPNVQAIIDKFQATVVEETVKPADSEVNP